MQVRLRRSSVVALVLVFVAGLSLAGVMISRAQTSPGCGPFEGPIVESEEFTPYEGRMSHLPDVPINFFGRQATAVPEDARVSSIDGLPLRWATGNDSGAVYQYFLDREMGSLTVPEFFAAGGIQLDRDPISDGEPYTPRLLATHGERAVRVEIGEYEAALVWADPESNGIRTHHLYWSDEGYNYGLMADRSPETQVTLGRDLVCGPN